MTDKKSNARWNNHPLISTVLWMLGTEGTETPESQPPSNASQTKINVMWRDHQGGGMDEYISQVQIDMVAGPAQREVDTSPGVQLRPQRFRTDDLLRDGADRAPASHPAHDHNDLPSESPQWGFYVAITPPQPELYPAMPKEVLHTVQADQRKAVASR